MSSCIRTAPFHIHPFTVGDVRIQFVFILPFGNRRIVRACPTQADLLVAIDYRESSRLRRGRLRANYSWHGHRGAGQQGGYRSAPPALRNRGLARQCEAGRLRKQMLPPSLHTEAERLRSTRVRNHRFGSEPARSRLQALFCVVRCLGASDRPVGAPYPPDPVAGYRAGCTALHTTVGRVSAGGGRLTPQVRRRPYPSCRCSSREITSRESIR